jgi:hypothetical protein
MSRAATPIANTQLASRRLTLGVARSAWIVVVTLAMGLFILSIPFQLTYYHIICSGAACPNDQISPEGFLQLQQAGLSPGFFAGFSTVQNVIVVLVFSSIAAVIFWRKSSDWMGIIASLWLVLYGINASPGAYTLVGQQVPAAPLISSFLNFLGSACFLLFFFLFPDGRFVPGWTRWLVLLVVVYAALGTFWPNLAVGDWAIPIAFASALMAQIYRYGRVSNAVQRQQTKWVVFGTAVAVAGLLAVYAYTDFASQGGTVGQLIANAAWSFFSLLIPLSIGLAILRSRLWDIDLLIRRTLIYGVLTVLLVFVYLGVVVALQAVFTALTGSARSELVTVLSTLAIAALFVPLRGRLQAFIDHRFYRRKYDAARTLAQFGANLRDEVNLTELSDHLLTAVDETMQPAAVSLWLRGKNKG